MQGLIKCRGNIPLKRNYLKKTLFSLHEICNSVFTLTRQFLNTRSLIYYCCFISDEELALEMSVLETLHGGQFTS